MQARVEECSVKFLGEHLVKTSQEHIRNEESSKSLLLQIICTKGGC